MAAKAVRQMGLKAKLHNIEFGYEEVKRLDSSTMKLCASGFFCRPIRRF